jgi:ectoine hydroxylase-related dioxygenase (phytanoyl-CoA dioxygenase family)
VEDGYLFLPGYLDREEVLKGRRTLLDALASEGVILAAEGPDEAKMAPGQSSYFRPELAQHPAIQSLLYSRHVMELFNSLFQEEAMHYDFTWLRAASPGVATRPHYDIVYMGRGTPRVCTAWIPYSDIDYSLSGLAILEGSHKLEDLKSTYGAIDVDRSCSNLEGKSEWEAKGLVSFGALPDSVGELAERFGLRWLTSEYRMGDLLIFSMYTLHCSTDNRSELLRLSTDSRYQPASEPADERWIGPVPIGHGVHARRETIC